MAMNPFGEWPAHLTVLEELILLVRGVQRDPVEWTDMKFDA
jgi:hypothetical protein